MINAFFLSANMSQFAHVSPICGIDEQFKLFWCRHRATGNRESLRSACFAIRRPQKSTVRSRRIRNGRKVLPITLALRQNLNPTPQFGNVRQHRHVSFVTFSHGRNAAGARASIMYSSR